MELQICGSNNDLLFLSFPYPDFSLHAAMPKTEPTLIFLSVSHFSLCWCDVWLCLELASREVTTT
ncbi:hypothetical protein J6590_071250 [Homalodisca vitripennis]|nr:hypothetical protein J6590_071250 [Homalodisca vitripennis]